MSFFSFCSFFKRFYLFIFRERGREGETEGEKQQCVVASQVAPTGNLAHNPGMCSDWESNQRPFGSQASTQSTEPHQPRFSGKGFNKFTFSQNKEKDIKYRMKLSRYKEDNLIKFIQQQHVQIRLCYMWVTVFDLFQQFTYCCLFTLQEGKWVF